MRRKRAERVDLLVNASWAEPNLVAKSYDTTRIESSQCIAFAKGRNGIKYLP